MYTLSKPTAERNLGEKKNKKEKHLHTEYNDTGSIKIHTQKNSAVKRGLSGAPGKDFFQRTILVAVQKKRGTYFSCPFKFGAQKFS